MSDDSDEVMVRRVTRMLVANPDHRIHRAELVEHLSTMYCQVTLRGLTRVWPEIERRVTSQKRRLFAVRPVGQLGYGVAATTNPRLALLSLSGQEKQAFARLNNLDYGQHLERLAAMGGEVGAIAAQRQERIRTYTASYRREQDSALQLEWRVLEEYRNLPWVEFNSSVVYARDEDDFILTPASA